MSDNAVVVEGLSKSYLLGHRSEQRARSDYVALRDVIGRGIYNFARRTVTAFRGGQLVQGDETELFWALKDVSFEIKHGEVLGIIGRNGAGKSTLLKILSRITEPTEGRVSLRGRIASLLEVGTGFHPELTGRENIYLNGAILGMTQREIRKKFDEIVEFAEVDKFVDTPVKHFSSGMYVRLAFAVAAQLESEILIIDEVLAVGDAAFQKKCLGKMSEVARGGRTVIFVSHNSTAIQSLCTHGIVLRKGIASPKSDVISALQSYVAEGTEVLTSSWRRPEGREKKQIYFASIDTHLEGSQPNLILICNVVIISEISGRPVFISVDIADRTGGSIMQAEPRCEPFIGGTPGSFEVELRIELPPLVPGAYSLHFWIGPHNTELSDWVSRAATIEIIENPNRERTFPYSIEHGSIIPVSKASVSTRRE
jgi:lipopolysaccharide transport system ATP-binding protein